ncbi:hypothetical protein ABTA61_19545, partial [Acinetobacter baumannii]
MTKTNRLLAGAGILLTVFASAAVVAAETAASEGLEEVVVTAQKRAETEQSVPMSMTTFGS